ncbi:MAG: hypothetical protein ACHQFZ_01260 [Acidimicrobiales bacterium]
MELRRLDVTLSRRDRVPAVCAGSPAPLVLWWRDGDPVVATASLGAAVTEPLGVWLEVTGAYPAALAARDVATLAWLVQLSHVVVDGENALDSAAALSALLTNDEVTFTNAAATLRGAYNRPAPPAPVTVWAFDGALRSGGRRLRERGREESPAGPLTRFA